MDDHCPRCELRYMADQISHNDCSILLGIVHAVMQDKHVGIRRLIKAYHLIQKG